MQFWQLPENIADILPSTARQIESAREQLLALFRVHGYELVNPPLLEYSTSLLTRIDEGLSLKTIRIVDQLSGRQLGIRADITPQVARIDAHLLSANSGINRLCYAGSVLHACPDGFLTTREPLQIGAELYGFSGIEADIELIDLMLKSLNKFNISTPTLSLGHLGIFNALASAAQLSSQQAASLLQLMQNKDREAIEQHLQQWQIEPEWRNAFITLPTLYGNTSVLQQALLQLPKLPAIQTALQQLQQICDTFHDHQIFIDLSDLRVDTYHTGLLFAVYSNEWPDALARGGRYDGLGQYFGRSRPASGFSFDLRNLIKNLPAEQKPQGIKVNYKDVAAAKQQIDQLRLAGECVIIDYTPQSKDIQGCDRQLVWQNQQWQVIPLS